MHKTACFLDKFQVFFVYYFLLIKINYNEKSNIFLSAIFITAQLTAQNQERLSVHFFDVPENLESEFLKFNFNVNNIPENSGHGKNFYKLYKLKKDDKKNIKIFLDQLLPM